MVMVVIKMQTVSTTMASVCIEEDTLDSRATPRQGRRRWPLLLAVGVVLVLVAAAGGAYGLGWVAHWRGTDRPPTPPMRPLSIATYAAGDGHIARPASGRPDPGKVRRALAGPLGVAALGKVVAEVAPLRGAPVLTRGSVFTPASTNKLLTTAAALHVLGPAWRGTTKAHLNGHTLTLADHGDVLLTGDQLDALAARTAAKLAHAGITSIRLRAEKGWYTGPDVNPRWPATYVPEEVVAPIDPLWVDEGHTPGPDGVLGTDDDGRVADPVAAALHRFANGLESHHIRAAMAPAGFASGRTIAVHTGAPLDQVVTHILQVSDNEGAETLGHLVGANHSFASGVTATLAALRQLGVPTAGLRLYDASGLSRRDRITSAAVVAVLQRAARDPRLGPILQGLPVAGWSGSLEDRFTTASGDGAALAARGVAHAKTGTLTGVSGLAGTVTDADGTPMIVVIVANHVTDTLGARAALDRAFAALASCHCS